MLLVFGEAQAQQDAPASSFVGAWTGYQGWAIENPPPERHPQPITFTMKLVDQKLVGVMSPFFGGTDTAFFTDVEITGNRLRARAAVGPPPADADTPQRPARGFVANVTVQFDFTLHDRNTLTGTADVFMGDVKWITFNYDLGRQRSRY